MINKIVASFLIKYQKKKKELLNEEGDIKFDNVYKCFYSIYESNTLATMLPRECD